MFLIVMLVLFVLGFVLDFLEIIYIVIPIVGPVIYGGTFDPKWVTIMSRGELTDFVPDAAVWLCVVLSARSCTQGSHNATYLSGIIPFVDPDRGFGLIVDLPERGDVLPRFDPELILTIR